MKLLQTKTEKLSGEGMRKYENIAMKPLTVEYTESHLRKGQITFLFVDNFIEKAILCSAGKALKLTLNYNNWITTQIFCLKALFNAQSFTITSDLTFEAAEWGSPPKRN